MTNGELITKLKRFPADAPVLVYHRGSTFGDREDLDSKEVNLETLRHLYNGDYVDFGDAGVEVEVVVISIDTRSSGDMDD